MPVRYSLFSGYHTHRLLFSFYDSVVNFHLTKRETVVKFVTVSQFSLWTGGRAAEGTGLLNRRTGYTGTAGSNPALSVFYALKLIM